MISLLNWSTVAVALITLIDGACSATAQQWRTRSIYQLLTDRFARTDLSTTAPCPSGYLGFCHGTWQGIIEKLDYIQGMGFDAIWISPITKQINDDSRAYHGYSQQDIYQVNSNFGTAQDLKNLAAALHARNMYLMIDLVTNHFGYVGDANSVDYSSMNPFNQKSQFHPVCWINNYGNQTELEQCWLGNENYPLPDVDTTQASVRETYSSWIKEIISTYSIDGIRIDSVKNVEIDFWTGFQSAAGVYAVGEVSSGDVQYACPYQGPLNGILNYPMYYQLTQFFSSPSSTSANIINQMQYLNSLCKDPTLLAPFSENHDQPRFPSYTNDMALANNVIAFTLLADGIPIIYSGQEQHLNGGADPYDREAIWLQGYNTSTPLYQLILKLNQIRQLAIAKDSNYVNYKAWIVYSDNHNLAIRKGFASNQIVAVYTNLGASASTDTLSVTNTGFEACNPVVEVLSCTEVNVGCDGTLTATVKGGLPLVYFPSAALQGSKICGR